MKIIVISGTPGTGKTVVSKKISEIISAKVISLNELVIAKKLTLEYDDKRDTYIVDFDKLIPYIKKLIKQFRKENYPFLILESHFADIVPSKFINYAIVLRCDPDELYNRLEKKGYKIKKIRENIQTEILGNCVNYLIQKRIKAPILEIDTTNLSVEALAKIIIEIIVENKNIENFTIGKVDWLEKLAQNNHINKFFD